MTRVGDVHVLQGLEISALDGNLKNEMPVVLKVRFNVPDGLGSWNWSQNSCCLEMSVAKDDVEPQSRSWKLEETLTPKVLGQSRVR